MSNLKTWRQQYLDVKIKFNIDYEINGLKSNLAIELIKYQGNGDR